MLKSRDDEKNNNLWLVCILIAIPLILVGISAPLGQAYAIFSPSYSHPVCYGITHSGACVQLEHPLIKLSGYPLITTA
jgi:hypothetical protein